VPWAPLSGASLERSPMQVAGFVQPAVRTFPPPSKGLLMQDPGPRDARDKFTGWRLSPEKAM
jgi:hypothetical protein